MERDRWIYENLCHCFNNDETLVNIIISLSDYGNYPKESIMKQVFKMFAVNAHKVSNKGNPFQRTQKINRELGWNVESK